MGTVADVVGTVPAHTNPLYDPNGAFTAIKTNMDAYPANGFRKAMAISIGQGDKTVGDTLAIYQAALIAATNYALGQWGEVFIGLTCDETTAGYSTWLSTIGQPARSAALASFVGNASVHVGVHLLATLGPLSVKSYDIGPSMRWSAATAAGPPHKKQACVNRRAVASWGRRVKSKGAGYSAMVPVLAGKAP